MSDNRRYQVFVSSTFEDLKEERKKIYETLLQIDCIPAGMEFFGAIDEEQFEFIKTIIDDSDYYIVIVGGRYGTLTEEGISYTEKEYLYAKEKGIPVCALIHSDPDNIPTGKSENSPSLIKKLNDFKNELATGRIKDEWNNSDDLAGKVLVSLTRTMKRFPRSGWIRGDKEASSQILQELAKANRTISILENQLSTITDNNKIPKFQIEYKEDQTDKIVKHEINLGKVALIMSTALFTPIPDHSFDKLLKNSVIQVINSNHDILIDKYNLHLLKAFLFIFNIISFKEESSSSEGSILRSFNNTRYVFLTENGKKLLSQII